MSNPLRTSLSKHQASEHSEATPYIYSRPMYIGENGTGYSTEHYTLIDIDHTTYIAGYVSKWDRTKKDAEPKTRENIMKTAKLKPITPLRRTI